MPTPKKGESQKEYIPRCISVLMHENPDRDHKQAIAICYSMYKNKKNEDQENLINIIDEWLVNTDITRIRNHIERTGDLIAAEAEQIYNKLNKLIKNPNSIAGFDFLRDDKRAEITISLTGNVHENQKIIRRVLKEFGNGWVIYGGSYNLSKSAIPQTWHIKKDIK